MKNDAGNKISSLCLALVPAVIAAFTLSCGPKNSVEDNETPTGPNNNGNSRSRLTGGTANGTTGAVSYCRVPLDMGTIVDPRRSGLTQTVLTTQIDNRCAAYQEVRLSVRAKQRITLTGKFVCRSGVQFNEQICTGMTQDVLNTQKNAVVIPVIADESWRPTDVEASVEFL
ncbi:MAG: hypothetical protein RLZZ488_1135 [Pseudomonadota bacterium]|jgi:hypothetical protein